MKKPSIKQSFSIKDSELDVNIIQMVKAINSFDGLYTIGSCGGHKNNQPFQLPENQWNVLFRVEYDKNKVSRSGWMAMEFLVWLCGDFRRSNMNVQFGTYAPPPYLNNPGSSVYFSIDGKDIKADDAARQIIQAKQELFVYD